MICFDPNAWDDYLYWQQNDKKTLKRINQLLKAIQRTPFDGLGKPEALEHQLAGCWSRRITAEHRLVYLLEDQKIIILQCRYHY